VNDEKDHIVTAVPYAQFFDPYIDSREMSLLSKVPLI
jgi:hypothetical protein